MQNSELFRRGIVVALDEHAEQCLRANDVDEAVKVRFLEISNDEIFMTLWHIGLFREINTRCSTMLDDYEEQMVSASSTAGILDAINTVARNSATQNPEVDKFLGDFQTLVLEARALSRPMMFVL